MLPFSVGATKCPAGYTFYFSSEIYNSGLKGAKSAKSSRCVERNTFPTQYPLSQALVSFKKYMPLRGGRVLVLTMVHNKVYAIIT